MAKYEDGELINLYLDGKAEAYYIKGWPYIKQMEDELLKEEIITSTDEIATYKKTYARWNIGRDEVGDPMSFLHQKDEAGKGRFKVTEIKLVNTEKSS